MTKRDKLIERMRRNPQSMRFDEIETLLLSMGFVRRQKGSSHAVFTLESYQVVIPFRKPTVKRSTFS